MRKTIFATCLATLAVLSLAACTKKVEQTPPADAAASTTAAAAAQGAPVSAAPRRGDPTHQ